MTPPRSSSRLHADDRQGTRDTRNSVRTDPKARPDSSPRPVARIIFVAVIAACVTACIVLIVVLSGLGLVSVAEYLSPVETIRHAVSRVLLVGGIIGLFVSLIAKWTD